MKESKYDESDKKCCEWIDEIISSKFTTTEDKELLRNIKTLLQECPKEELEPYRGKYLAFVPMQEMASPQRAAGDVCGVASLYYAHVKDDKNKYQLYEYVFNNYLEVADKGLRGAYLFFIPTENKYCGTAQMPYRNAIEKKPNKYTPLKNSIRIADESSSQLPVTALNGAPHSGADSNLHRYNCIIS